MKKVVLRERSHIGNPFIWNYKFLALWVLGLSFSAGAVADTLTWKTDISSGRFSDAANWTSDGYHAAPQPGDTCVFPNSEVTLEAETVSLGDAGFTLQNTQKLHIHATFTGNGGIVKKGSGRVVIYGDTGGDFKGGVTFEAGLLDLKNRYRPGTTTAGLANFGAGTITFKNDSTDPFLDIDEWAAKLSNPIVLEGRSTSANGAFYLHQQMSLSGNVTSYQDFLIVCGYRDFTLSGAFSAPGKTVTVQALANSNAGSVTMSGSIDASLVKQGNRNLILSGQSSGYGNSLLVKVQTNVIASAGFWQGTNVTVNGGNAVLWLQGAQNLSRLARVELLNGGRLNFDAACAVHVSGLFANGAWQPAGTYRNADFPSAIIGNGSITVDAYDKAWIGGGEGLWSVGSNWTGGVAPVPGDRVLIETPVVFGHETVDLGTEGFVICNTASLTSHITFTGVGGLTKKGTGAYFLEGDAGGDFKGGVRLLDGVLMLHNRYADRVKNTAGLKYFGAGPITLVSENGLNPYVDYNEWASGLTNKIVISGTNRAANGALYAHQYVSPNVGPLEADGDFLIKQSYSTMTLTSINAPGKTVTVDCTRILFDGKAVRSDSPVITLSGRIDANISKSANIGPLNFSGVSPNPDNVLYLPDGTNTFTAAAVWGGTNVTFTGSRTMVKLQGKDNFSANAEVKVSNGAKIEVAAGVKVHVGALWVDGVRMPDSIYTAASLPATLAGAGKLRVGNPGVVIIFR